MIKIKNHLSLGIAVETICMDEQCHTEAGR